jgi:hypothetical protein
MVSRRSLSLCKLFESTLIEFVLPEKTTEGRLIRGAYRTREEALEKIHDRLMVRESQSISHVVAILGGSAVVPTGSRSHSPRRVFMVDGALRKDALGRGDAGAKKLYSSP